MRQREGGPVGGAGPVAFARFPLSARGDCPSTGAGPVTVGARPLAAAFAVAPVRVKHRKTRTHGVETKATCNILDGTDEPDTIDEPYEDEE
ncbi:MAG: hypothetical protein ACRDQY_09245 [Pseudonocardiaceae bacterium]